MSNIIPGFLFYRNLKVRLIMARLPLNQAKQPTPGQAFPMKNIILLYYYSKIDSFDETVNKK